MKKAQEEQEKKNKAEKEKQMAESQRKKFLKEQENKKKQIAEYKKKKMEAEEMLANADLPEYDYEDYDSYSENIVKNQKKSGTKMSGAQQMDDEDRYLEEILSKNYINGKAPPAV